jgi:hypothetical protein
MSTFHAELYDTDRCTWSGRAHVSSGRNTGDPEETVIVWLGSGLHLELVLSEATKLSNDLAECVRGA